MSNKYKLKIMKTVYYIKNRTNGVIVFQSEIESTARIMCNHQTEYVTSNQK